MEDKYPEIDGYIDALGKMEKIETGEILEKVRLIINVHHPNLFDDVGNKFPMMENLNHWYDKNPEWWLSINSLPFLDARSIEKIVALLKQKTKHQ